MLLKRGAVFSFSFVLCDSIKEELRIYIDKTTLNSLNYNIVVFTATGQLLSLFMSLCQVKMERFSEVHDATLVEARIA